MNYSMHSSDDQKIVVFLCPIVSYISSIFNFTLSGMNKFNFVKLC